MMTDGRMGGTLYCQNGMGGAKVVRGKKSNGGRSTGKRKKCQINDPR